MQNFLDEFKRKTRMCEKKLFATKDFQVKQTTQFAEQKLFFQRKPPDSEWKQNRHFYYITSYLNFFIRKSEPLGVSFFGIRDFLHKGKVRNIKGKGDFSPFFLSNLEKIGLITTKSWNCRDTQVVQKRFIQKKSQTKSKNAQSLLPCVNCPISYECHPQGIINPFDCIFLEYWEKDIKEV